jgi:hypothetical protein
MRWKWSLEHVERRIDRYYRLAAAARIPELRQHYIAMARRYRLLWTTAISRTQRPPGAVIVLGKGKQRGNSAPAEALGPHGPEWCVMQFGADQSQPEFDGRDVGGRRRCRNTAYATTA